MKWRTSPPYWIRRRRDDRLPVRGWRSGALVLLQFQHEPADLLRPAAGLRQLAGPVPGRLLVGHADHGEPAEPLRRPVVASVGEPHTVLDRRHAEGPRFLEPAGQHIDAGDA